MQSPQPIGLTPFPCRILVVDDHPLLRIGIRIAMLAADICMSDDAETAHEAAEMVRAGEHNLVLLDDSLSGCDIAESIQIIRSARPDVRIVVIGDYSVASGVAAMRAGATGYVGKDINPDQLVDVVKMVASGKKYIDNDVAAQILTAITHKNHYLPHLNLSKRETQVFRMMASGEALSAVAQCLGLSKKTVSVYRARVLEKMGLRNNAEVVRYAARICLTGDVAAT